MTEKTHEYSKGDWIVHSFYGIGQIKGIDVKDISGEETRYYRIRTSDSAFWMPVDQMDSDVLRPLSSPKEIEQAISTLRKPPKRMSSNYKMRQNRIRKAQLRNTPRAIARVIRDLRGRQREKGLLNGTELTAFRSFKQRLAEEWAMVMDTETDAVISRLDDLLEPQQDKENGESSQSMPKDKLTTGSVSPMGGA